MNMRHLQSRFDWYEFTFDGFDDGREVSRLALALGGTVTAGRGRNGYATCSNIERDGNVLAQVYGHSARAGEVHITITSESCDEVVPIIRRLWPDHRVSRADSSVDFAMDFETLDSAAVAFAEARNLSHRLFTSSDGGATRYIGARSSEVFVRVYKKSEQLRALHPERALEIPDGVVRFELVTRPNKREVKSKVAQMAADELWGLGKWAQEFALEFLEIDAPRVSTHFRRPSDWSRALHYLGAQYKPMIQRRIAEVGLEVVRDELTDVLGLS